MDISGLGIGQIMQLPDWVFGRRFVVSVDCRAGPDETVWDISELGLPQDAVIWQLQIYPYGVSHSGCYVRLALGDQLPTTAAQMDGLEPLIAGLGAQGAEPRRIYCFHETAPYLLFPRMQVKASGRRLVMEATAGADQYTLVAAQIVVSSVPRAVPDVVVGMGVG